MFVPVRNPPTSFPYLSATYSCLYPAEPCAPVPQTASTPDSSAATSYIPDEAQGWRLFPGNRSGRLGKSAASTPRPKGICLGPPGPTDGVSARGVLSGEPVHRLPDEIGVAHVPRVLLYKVDQDSPQAR